VEAPVKQTKRVPTQLRSTVLTSELSLNSLVRHVGISSRKAERDISAEPEEAKQVEAAEASAHAGGRHESPTQRFVTV